MATLVDPLELQRVLGMAGNTLYEPGDYERAADAASDYVEHYLEPDVDHTLTAAVREAALAIAVELWQHRLAAGGTVQAADWTPSPYRLGRGLLSKVQGLLGPYIDTGSMIG